MTVTRSKYNSGCLFCSALGDRGLVNHHLNRFIPILALKLKSIQKVVVDDFHPVDIVTAARYGKQSSGTRSQIADGEWNKPELAEWIVLVEFGKRAVVPLSGLDAFKKHKSRARIQKTWWEAKAAEAVRHNGGSRSFDLDAFITSVIREAYGIWYPGEEYVEPRAESPASWNPQIEQITDGPVVDSSVLEPSKSSAYISTRMAAIVMDPENDQEPKKRTNRGSQRSGSGQKRTKIKRGPDVSDEEKPIKLRGRS